MKNIFEEWRILEEQNKIENGVNGKSVLFDSRFDFFIKRDSNANLSITILCNEPVEKIEVDMYGISVKNSIDRDIDPSKEAVIIKNTNPNNSDIFMAFSASLYEKAISKNNENIINLIKETMNDYIDYFKGNKKGLSEIEQQGLFGELTFINENVESNKEIINNWEGIFKNKHDFVFKDYSVEIKTTRNQTELDIKISNENQLDNSYVKELELVVYRLEKVNVGKTLYDLYQELVNKIDKKYLIEFKAKLIKAGFDINEMDNLERFRLVERYDFIVNDSFPKITKKELITGVHDVKYSILIDGLERDVKKYGNE